MSLSVNSAVRYAIFGIIWILLSDFLVSAAFPQALEGEIAQTIKGLLFIGLSAVYVFLAADGASCRAAAESDADPETR